MISARNISEALKGKSTLTPDDLKKLKTDFPFFALIPLLEGGDHVAPLSVDGVLNPVLVSLLKNPRTGVWERRAAPSTMLREEPQEKQPQEAIEVLVEENSKPEVAPDAMAQAAPAADFSTDQSEAIRPEEKTAVPISEAPAQDFFASAGIAVSNDLPPVEDVTPAQNGLMVMRSFSEWMRYFQQKNKHEAEEAEEKQALKLSWQRQRLAALAEEEDDDIPQDVLEMALSSVSHDNLASESLAQLHLSQGRPQKAIAMYQILASKNPEKSSYFAALIEAAQDRLRDIL